MLKSEIPTLQRNLENKLAKLKAIQEDVSYLEKAISDRKDLPDDADEMPAASGDVKNVTAETLTGSASAKAK